MRSPSRRPVVGAGLGRAGRRRRLVPVLALVCALGVGACGGGGGSDETPPATPGANVDPNATGVVGGSINRAKDVADDAESRDAQLEEQGGGGSTTP